MAELEFLFHDPCLDCISLAICQRSRNCPERIDYEQRMKNLRHLMEGIAPLILKKYEDDSFISWFKRGANVEKRSNGKIWIMA